MNPLRHLYNLFLGPPKVPAADDLVLLGRPDGEAEAELWKNILMQWGVRALVRNVSSLAYLRLGDMFEVWVLQQDLEYARSLLDLPGAASFTEEANPDPEPRA